MQQSVTWSTIPQDGVTSPGETVEACNDLDLDIRHIRRKNAPMNTDYNWGGLNAHCFHVDAC